MADDEVTQGIAVIGGGLAGLSAAHHLIELIGKPTGPRRVTVFEAGPKLGGIVGTERIDGYLVDVGADSFLTNKPAAVELCRRLRIEDRLRATDKRFRGAHVLFEGRPVPIPEGFQLLSPTAMWPVMTSPLFSTWGKLRMLTEWAVPPRIAKSQDLVDESLAEFSRRRFGREAFDRLIQPLIGGIYTADPEKLSLAATMPRFLEMERDYGSLIRATLSRKKSAQSMGADNSRGSDTGQERDRSSGARYGMFAGLAGGMSDLVDALRASVESNCRVELKRSVTAVSSLGSKCFTVSLDDGTLEKYSAVIVATTAPRAANLLASLDSGLQRELSQIEYASSALVVTGHNLADIAHPLDSFGLVVPRVECRKILAVSFSSRKFPERAPHGKVLLRTFVGGALQPELLQQTDDELLQMVGGELAEIFGVRGQPDFGRVYRYRQSMPQYHVGHLDRVARIDQIVNRYSGLALAGNAYRGAGVPDTIASGERAAADVAGQMLPG